MYARKKDIVILTDLYGYSKFENIDSFIVKPFVHTFLLYSPLEKMKKLPFSIYKKETHNFVSANFSNFDSVEKKRIKELNIEDRYLENFIQGMI